MYRLLLALLIVPFLPSPLAAQEAAPLVVMNLAAHPDDEDGSTLAYYRWNRDAVAYSVIFTRGEGGQNEIGPELYEALGALRTDETERAARVLGTQVFFLNFQDFGYSKTAAETFERWGGRDRVTAELVYLIRKLKPDVLFTNHDTLTVGPSRQHGHHQAVGLSAYDAFSLAADASFHPEQLTEEGVDLWQPKRLFLRLWRPEGEHDVAVPVGTHNSSIGDSYGGRAATALLEHASQGMQGFASRLRTLEANHFRLLRSATDAPLDPADLGGNLVPNTTASPDITYWIDSGRLPALIEGTVTLEDSVAIPGQRVRLRWNPEQLPHRRVQWRFSGAVDTTLFLADETPGAAWLTVDAGAVPSTPKVTYQYERIRSRPPVRYSIVRAGTDEVLAAGYLPLEIAPPVHLASDADVIRLRPGENRLPVTVQLFDPSVHTVRLQAAISRDDQRAVLLQHQISRQVESPGTVRESLRLVLPDSLASGGYTVTLTALATPSLQTPTAAHEHVSARSFTTEVPNGLVVGVVESYDDGLARALDELGVRYVSLDSLDLATGDFSGLHTVVADIRAYLVRGDLRRHNDRLLDWVRRGGHLVVNYHKTFEWNADGFAPYPLTLGRARVTDESAPVTLLQPDHPLFNAPNPVEPSDWDGWTQERGLYFPESYDERYEELLEMNDPGEPPLRGAVLLAAVGEGTYLYTSLVWYRQLKAFNAGAYRLFANMLALPLIDGRNIEMHVE